MTKKSYSDREIRRRIRALEDGFHPHIVGLVRVLARQAATADFRALRRRKDRSRHQEEESEEEQ